MWALYLYTECNTKPIRKQNDTVYGATWTQMNRLHIFFIKFDIIKAGLIGDGSVHFRAFTAVRLPFFLSK